MKKVEIKYTPEYTETSFTLGEFLDAVEKNGLPQERGMWFNTTSTFDPKNYSTITVFSACAAGQGALNLGIGDTNALQIALRHFKLNSRDSLRASNIIEGIINLNDRRNWSIPAIVRHYRKIFADRLDERVTVTHTTKVTFINDVEA